MSDNEIKFNACAFLDFSDNYDAKKNAISTKEGTKAFWLRDVDPELPPMVQFCKKRGRLNNPYHCLCQERARCSSYVKVEHIVVIED